MHGRFGPVGKGTQDLIRNRQPVKGPGRHCGEVARDVAEFLITKAEDLANQDSLETNGVAIGSDLSSAEPAALKLAS